MIKGRDADSAPTLPSERSLACDAAGRLKVTAAGVLLLSSALVTSANVYSSGQDVGGVFTFVNAVPVDGGNAFLESLLLVDTDAQGPAGNILLFNTDPVAAGWTLTDHATAVATATAAELIAMIPVASADWIAVGTKKAANYRNQRLALNSATGQNKTIFAAFVTTGTPTYTGVASLKAKALFSWA